MADIKGIKIQDYTYELPDSKIAKYPLQERDQSNLLVFKNETITDSKFNQLPKFIESKSLLIFNNTKVIQARLHFHKETGAKIEIFCLEPYLPSDYSQNFASQSSCQWICIIGNLKKWKESSLKLNCIIDNKGITLTATKKEIQGQNQIIEFSWNDNSICFADILKILGNIPIPPYLNRNADDSDLERYQTIYSKYDGSVAAPTAGLHFTDEVINSLANKGAKFDEVTLHVGAGTFKPVKTEFISQHDMHVESILVTSQTIENIKNSLGHIVAVGTTSVRTLESLYWLGVKCIEAKHKLTEYSVSQWDAYQLPQNIQANDALEALLKNMQNNKETELIGKTQIMIVPGYDTRIVETIITNFHQPESTLLLLISAFVGDNWKKIYNYALENNYRFLSYGDSSLLFKQKNNSK